MFWRKAFRMLLNKRGAVGDQPPADAPKKVEFSTEQQAAVDGIVKERLAREREKYRDYDDLKKFKDDTERAKSEQDQKSLEDQKKYEEAKSGYEKKIKDYEGIVAKKDGEISDLKITHALTSSISAENGYVEESLALMRSMASINQDGVVVVKVKDANGIENVLPASEGVKWFLKQRPHLVKSNARGGGGTPPGAPPAGGGAGTEDLTSLNNELQQAITSGDHKRAGELKVKIQSVLNKRNVRRTL